MRKYDIRKLMKFEHRCIEARWNDKTSKWHVKVEVPDGSTHKIIEDIADVFVAGVGVLNNWNWPDIKGLHDFKGKLLHSANWDTTFDATGQNIAVIGAGSSGIQIVPALLPKVKTIDHYVRGRTWIAASFGSEIVRQRNDGEDGNFDYSPEEVQGWKDDPASYVKYRKTLELGMQGNFALTHRGTKEHQGAWTAFDADMRKRLAKKSHIADNLIPSFPPLCKRLTPGPGYLEALVADNVTVIPEQISHVDATGIMACDGIHRPVDAIITATGFDTSFQGRFPIYGIAGVNLQDRNRIRAETYLGIAVDEFPNFFYSLGPNSGAANGNLLLIIESVANYIGQILEKMSKGNVKTIVPTRQNVENFTNYCDAYFKRTVFSADCGSWYKVAPPNATAEERKKGRIAALWPGSSVHVARALENVRFEDYEMTTVDGNAFGWFGDGWSVAERTGDVEGLSWYLNGTKFTHEPLEKVESTHVQGKKTRDREGVKESMTESQPEVLNGVLRDTETGA